MQIMQIFVRFFFFVFFIVFIVVFVVVQSIFEFCIGNDIFVGNSCSDDFYMVGFVFIYEFQNMRVNGCDFGCGFVMFEENFFIDCEVGQCFDESWFLLGCCFCKGNMNYFVYVGVVCVGCGVFGECV